MQFPNADPIPVPAPVWLMKLLGLLTLSLHFVAVMMLVGCLILIVTHNFRGRSKKNSHSLSASYVIARRLPVLMTYVINLGVPPLLFAQVLYGRAIYSSSILIGVSWLSVIFLLMLDYWLLYRVIAWMETNKPAWVLAVLAFFITLGIGQIYAMNMTLMLRPEVWTQMYAHSPQGLQAYTGDPTTTPRWLFVMAGGPIFGGLFAVLLSNMKHIDEEVKAILRKSGGLSAAAGAFLQLGCAYLVYSRQPDHVKEALGKHLFYSSFGVVFMVTTLLAGVLALVLGLRKTSNLVATVGSIVVAFLGTAGAVVYRDGIRDATLFSKGFDVWNRVEVSNWTVIGAFLLLFVIMLGIIVGLLRVMTKATAPQESLSI